jgi:hypothetical protein
MTKHGFLSFITLLAGLLLNFGTIASEPREITWDDLVPAEAQFDDVYTRLSEDHLFELSLVAQIRDRLEAGQEVDDKTLANYHERVKGLQEDDIDIDGLIAMRDQVAEERQAKLLLTNVQLDGKQVRIPGYLLPLEFNGDKVTEFFLVPYVGACIHTPPPPPNQIVHVRTDEPYTTDGGLYTPVWVNGLIKIEKTKSSLNLVDGSSDIPSSYALEATNVEPYE